MRTDTVLLFDDFLSAGPSQGPGGTPVVEYTSLEHTAFLTSADRLGLQAIIEVSYAVLPVPIELTLETSGNGRDWKPKNATPELSAAVGPAKGRLSLTGGEPRRPRPRQRFARLRVSAGDGKRKFGLHLSVYASARSWTKQAPRPRPPDWTASSLLGMPHESLLEIVQVIHDSGDLIGPARLDHVLRSLGAETRRDVEDLALRLRTLDSVSKRLLIGGADALRAVLGADIDRDELAAHLTGSVDTPDAHESNEVCEGCRSDVTSPAQSEPPNPDAQVCSDCEEDMPPRAHRGTVL